MPATKSWRQGLQGTDQEYLLLNRLWPKVAPAVVVLIYCSQNARFDISSNVRYQDYSKPYFVMRPDGSLELKGQPIPASQVLRYNVLVRNLLLARLVARVYVRLRYSQILVPDPTEKLVGKIREFVEANGAKFLVGIQHRDEAMVRYLEANRIPFASLYGAGFYQDKRFGPHWTPEGQKFVAIAV